MPRRNNKQQREGSRQNFVLKMKVLDIVHSVVRNLIKWGFFAFAIKAVADALAGKMTFADIVIKVSGILPDDTICKILAGGLVLAVGWAYFERKLRYRVIARQHDLGARYEQIRDPNRSSSRIMPDGRTRPED
ncbi:MAG: hypothetical protein AABZ64_09465 [Nitrospinota bacterium]